MTYTNAGKLVVVVSLALRCACLIMMTAPGAANFATDVGTIE